MRADHTIAAEADAVKAALDSEHAADDSAAAEHIAKDQAAVAEEIKQKEAAVKEAEAATAKVCQTFDVMLVWALRAVFMLSPRAHSSMFTGRGRGKGRQGAGG